MGFVTRVLSPYEFNPSDYNPLRNVVEQSIDFEVLRHPDCPVKLFSRPQMFAPKVKVFAGQEFSICRNGFSVPSHDVSRGRHRWRSLLGRRLYGNPALFPLIYNCKKRPTSVIVHINPLYRKELPYAAGDILNRINEISFNSH